MWDECLEVGENEETHGRIGMRELTLRIQVTNKYQYEEASLGSVVEEIGHEVAQAISLSIHLILYMVRLFGILVLYS
jgi:hypothetical protein